MSEGEGIIAALLLERTGYVARGLSDRVAQVDAALALAGFERAVPEPPPSAPVRPLDRAVPEPKTRRG